MTVVRFLFPAAVLAIGSASLALAQAAEPQPLSIASLAVERYAEVTETGGDGGVACCAPMVLSQPGHHFVYLRLVFDVAWSDTLDRISISSSDIGLLLPGEAEPRPMIGRMSALGEFALSGSSLSARRPNNWPAETEQGYLNAVFLLPETVTSGTLVFEDTAFAQDIALAAPVSEIVDPATLLSVSVTGLVEVDEVVTVQTASRTAIAGRLAPTLGAIVQLDMTVQPLLANDLGGSNSFFFTTEDFTLVGPDNAPMRYIGTVPNEAFLDTYSYFSTWEAGDLPRAQTLRLFFSGNTAPGVYKLFYLGTPVADVMMP